MNLREEFEKETGIRCKSPCDDDQRDYWKAYANWLEAKLSGEKEQIIAETVEMCKDELLKQLVEVLLSRSDYPIRAVPQTIILSLPALIKLHRNQLAKASK